MVKKNATTVKNETKKASKQVINANDTRVVCPVCGSEFDVLAPHEHKEKNVTVLGMDSGLGTIVLPVSKRGEALEKAGINPDRYFSMKLPNGTERLMTYDANGDPVAVKSDDPIMKAILGGGTVPNKRLFRRWVTSQVFHGLQDKHGGFSNWLTRHGYDYQWEMLMDELRVQAKLYIKDMENFDARNRWFNKDLAYRMAEDYVEQVRKDAEKRPTRKCKGTPYIVFSGQNVFVADIQKKILWPLRSAMSDIHMAKTPEQLYEAVKAFWDARYRGSHYYKQSSWWKDAYKGMGAYATMQNLLRFHGCVWPKDNEFADLRMTDLRKLDNAADHYRMEGWRLFGLLKQMLEYNHIDIDAKMKEWARAKAARKSA